MTNKILLMAETGSDISAEVARQRGILLVPMHVSMDGRTLDDGTFPPEDVCRYYDRTGKVPTTSGSTVYDFEVIFERVFAEDPQAQVLYMAYSAVTTCSYHSAQLALEGKPYADRVRLLDTRHVSSGQCMGVLTMADWLQDHPQATLDEAADAARALCSRLRMCFIPKNLDYLRSGGRCSNAAALIGSMLQLHPCISLVEGRLAVVKKYRGSLVKLAPTVLRDFTETHDLDKSLIFLIRTPRMEEALCATIEQQAIALGFQQMTWVDTGSVITCHGGPGSFGFAGMTRAEG